MTRRSLSMVWGTEVCNLWPKSPPSYSITTWWLLLRYSKKNELNFVSLSLPNTRQVSTPQGISKSVMGQWKEDFHRNKSNNCFWLLPNNKNKIFLYSLMPNNLNSQRDKSGFQGSLRQFFVFYPSHFFLSPSLLLIPSFSLSLSPSPLSNLTLPIPPLILHFFTHYSTKDP